MQGSVANFEQKMSLRMNLLNLNGFSMTSNPKFFKRVRLSRQTPEVSSNRSRLLNTRRSNEFTDSFFKRAVGPTKPPQK